MSQRFRLALTVTTLLLITLTNMADARPPVKRTHRLLPPPSQSDDFESRADTLFLFASSGPGAWGMPGTDSRGYTWNNNETAGWTGLDESEQTGTFWHIAPTTICAGSSTDITPVLPFDPLDFTNDYALWCGALDVCGWHEDSGYGNNWKQWVIFNCGDWVNNIRLDFTFISDFEGSGYERFEVLLEVDDDLETIYYNGFEQDQTIREIVLQENAADYPGEELGDLYFYFYSDGGWSDEDGSYISDYGAVWVDNVILTADGQEIGRSDFEDGIVPDWVTFAVPDGAGDFAALYHNLWVEQFAWDVDQTCVNNSHAWAFFDIGTTSASYPIPIITYGPPYISNMIVSPVLDRAHSLDDQTGQELQIDPATTILFNHWLYMDMQQGSEIYYLFEVGIHSSQSECSLWRNNNSVYYGGDGIWFNSNFNGLDVSELIFEAAGDLPISGIQVKMGVIDMHEIWYPSALHTPAPYFDNARIMLVNTAPFTWDHGTFHQFQDNFAATGSGGPGGAPGKVRLDSPVDIAPPESPLITPGDSIVVGLGAGPAGGLALEFNTTAGEMRPALYLWWRCVAGPHQDITGPDAADPDGSDGIWSPYAGTQEFGGYTWNLAQADSAWVGGIAAPDSFAFDLADDYFEPGDQIQYFYRAQGADGTLECSPAWAMSDDPALREYFTLRCLPTPDRRLLLVEDGDNRFRTGGFRWHTVSPLPAYMEALLYCGYSDYDIYTTHAPSLGMDNAPGGRGTAADLAGYEMIIWDTGSSSEFTLTCPQNGAKSDDTALLEQWLNQTDHDTGLWLLGDWLAEDLTNSPFRTQVMAAALAAPGDSYSDITGITSPRILAIHPDLEWLGDTPSFHVIGGCWSGRRFAAVQTAGDLAVTTHQYEIDEGLNLAAGILNLDPDGNGTDLSATGHSNRVLYNPFSYSVVRDDGYGTAADRIYIRYMVGQILWELFTVENDTPFNAVPEGQAAPPTKLIGASPNPFNPSTEIRFNLSVAGPMTLRVHDLAGRRVHTLVAESLPAGEHAVTWDSRNDQGHRVASGIYFLQMETGDYRASSKLVLVK